MPRPASVTAAAVVAFLGCAVTLLMAAGMVMVTLVPVAPTPMPRQFGIGMAVMFALLAALGVTTGVAILRLREWGRVAMLVFAGAMTLFSALGTLMVALLPMQNLPAEGANIARATVAVVYAVPLAVGIWWLILFTRPGVIAAFASGDAATSSPRPLAVTIIAYWVIIGGAGTLLMSAIGMPAFILGFVATGAGAVAVYVVQGALNLYAGWGLLKRREPARLLTIGLFGLGVAQALMVAVMPSVRERLFTAQRSLAGNVPPPAGLDPTVMGMWFMGAAAVIAAVCIWLLVRARPSFQVVESPPPPA